MSSRNSSDTGAHALSYVPVHPLRSTQASHASHRGSILTHTHLGAGRENKKAATPWWTRRQNMSLTVASCLSSEASSFGMLSCTDRGQERSWGRVCLC